MSSEEFNESFINKQERLANNLDMLAERTGFKPDDKLTELGRQIIAEPQKAESLIKEWMAHGQEIIDSLPEAEKISAQIGLMASQAALLYRVNLTEFADNAVEQAIDLAYQMGFNNIAQELANF